MKKASSKDIKFISNSRENFYRKQQDLLAGVT
jgi:hypothetical protein